MAEFRDRVGAVAAVSYGDVEHVMGSCECGQSFLLVDGRSRVRLQFGKAIPGHCFGGIFAAGARHQPGLLHTCAPGREVEIEFAVDGCGPIKQRFWFGNQSETLFRLREFFHQPCVQRSCFCVVTGQALFAK